MIMDDSLCRPTTKRLFCVTHRGGFFHFYRDTSHLTIYNMIFYCEMAAANMTTVLRVYVRIPDPHFLQYHDCSPPLTNGAIRESELNKDPCTLFIVFHVKDPTASGIYRRGFTTFNIIHTLCVLYISLMLF